MIQWIWKKIIHENGLYTVLQSHAIAKIQRGKKEADAEIKGDKKQNAAPLISSP